MSQEDKPVAEVLSTQVEAWQREVSALQEKIAFAIGKPVAEQEPVAEWKYGRFLHLNYKVLNPNTHVSLYANATPCARCKELECDVAHWKANHDNRVEAARLLIDRPDLPLERVKAYQAHIALQAKITEQAALIEKMDIENTSCRVRIGTLNAQLTTPADRSKALESEVERQRKVIEAAKGLSFGVDWNKGTHAKIYRPRLLAAIAELEKGVV